MKNRIFRNWLLGLGLLAAGVPAAAQTCEVDLSGVWRFQTDVMDFRRGSLSPRYNHMLPDSIVLPGITDDYGIGYESPYRHVDRLTRLYEYMAPAWYQRDIEFPAEWAGKRIFLYFERTHWLSSVWVDTKEVSRIDYISVPHNHELTDFITPGKKHRITVCIDNRYRYDTHKWNHAHTEFTQINWNGILGEMKLVAVDPVCIEELQPYPRVADRSVEVRLTVGNRTGRPFEGKALVSVSGNGVGVERELRVRGDGAELRISGRLPLGDGARLWDEFSPVVYTLRCRLLTQAGGSSYEHEKTVDFGLREVAQGRNHVLLNGRPIHLRGTVENAVFPKTGHAPVGDAEWERIMSIVKEYGLNHIRFHSWCPPRAAFRAADRHGVYLEVEMPMWGKDAEPDSARYDFFRREMRAILREYGNHPSFILYCNGNEITGNYDFIEELTATARALDDRHLYSGSTARTRIPSDQFYVSQQTNKGPVKVYEGRPTTDWDRNRESDVDVPVISHESGQRCIYPDFREIEKFTGPVRARNFELWREMLERNGMLDQAYDFFRASGTLTVVEYKAVIEALLRSSRSAGFQLLSLNAFPGQGYAPVGILDPFWDSKGLVTPEQWRAFCAPTVALLRYAKSSWYEGETFTARAEVYNFGASELGKVRIRWSLLDSSGASVARGSLGTRSVGKDGVFPLGEFSVPLDRIRGPQRLTLRLEVGDAVSNSWNIWVFPRNDSLLQSDDRVLYTREFDSEAERFLAAGKTVVLTPAPSRVAGRPSTFHNHFWNPIMFAWSPMTIGCLIHDQEPVFDDFPTSYHTDWQWWDILENARVIDLQETPRELRPFIQVIDSFDSNRKLGIGFEARVGKGKLLVLAVDTGRRLDERPATRQLLASIDRYVHSDRFDPQVPLDETFIRSFLRQSPKK